MRYKLCGVLVAVLFVSGCEKTVSGISYDTGLWTEDGQRTIDITKMKPVLILTNDSGQELTNVNAEIAFVDASGRESKKTFYKAVWKQGELERVFMPPDMPRNKTRGYKMTGSCQQGRFKSFGDLESRQN